MQRMSATIISPTPHLAVKMSSTKKSQFDVEPQRWTTVPGLLTGFYTLGIFVSSFLTRSNDLGSIISALLPRGPTFEGLDEPTRVVVALGLVYTLATYIGSSILSVTGQAMGNPSGYKNSEPRVYRYQLRGLPGRFVAANDALLDSYPSFVLAVMLHLTVPAPASIKAHNLNRLALHVILKCFIYYPAYLFDISPLRTISHITSVGCLVGLMWSIIQAGAIGN
jgi:uncharacterized MAPEG superfamily protein